VGLGVGDLGAADGRVRTAVAAREAVRRRLAGLPNVGVADAEAAVRAVGARRAHHPALFAMAKIPYTEEVFAELGGQVAAVLATRLGAVTETVVLDADSLLGVEGADVLGTILPAVRRAGIRVAVRGAGEITQVWPSVAACLGESWRDCLDDWVIDDRPLEVQLADVAEHLGTDTKRLALLVAGSVVTGPPEPAPRVVRLGADPLAWPAELTASGVLDRVPVALAEDSPEVARTARPVSAMSLEDYVAGLGVHVDFRSGGSDSVPQLAENLIRTKDFTLGIVHPEHDLAERAVAGDIEIQVGHVRDRLGDYGDAVTIAASYHDDVCVVSAFTVSCPVLGKGVEEAALGRILGSARERGCRTVVFERSETGRNDLMLEFLARVSGPTDGLLVETTAPR
jgi:FkbH-like protein